MIVGFIAAAALPIAGLFGAELPGLAIGLVSGALLAVLAKVIHEGSMMVADIADVAVQSAAGFRRQSNVLPDESVSPNRTIADMPVGTATAPSPLEEPSSDAQVMERYRIRKEGSQFIYGKYSFDSLEGAARYARQHPPRRDA